MVRLPLALGLTPQGPQTPPGPGPGWGRKGGPLPWVWRGRGVGNPPGDPTLFHRVHSRERNRPRPPLCSLFRLGVWLKVPAQTGILLL